jgi:hypothetical protein
MSWHSKALAVLPSSSDCGKLEVRENGPLRFCFLEAPGGRGQHEEICLRAMETGSAASSRVGAVASQHEEICLRAMETPFSLFDPLDTGLSA